MYTENCCNVLSKPKLKCESIAENVLMNMAVLHYKTFCNKINAPDPADRKIGASNLTIF